MVSQEDEILKYLQEGNSLTPMEALREFGVFRLGARIYDLKQKGFDIKSTTVELNGKRFAKYFI